MRQLCRRAVLGALLLWATAQADVAADLRTVLPWGPRVTGSEANERARVYFETQFRALGYQTRREAFTYARFDDLGSEVQAGQVTLAGRAVEGSVGGEVSAAVVRVPGVGRPADFQGVEVRGRVAVVERGGVTFGEKARSALAAGAAGLIIVNSGPGELQARLGERLALPVLAVRAEVGAALRAGQQVTVRVRVREGEVRGVNVVAARAGVTAPDVLFGAHLDSVFRSPGANDNLSGTLAVLETAARVAGRPLAERSMFVLFDGEEDGLLGARHFTARNGAVVEGLRAMFNFDMVGVDASPLSASGDEGLVEVARRAGVRAVPGVESGSDHVPFAQAGVPTLFFHRGLDVNYHQPTDLLATPALIQAAVDAALPVAEAALASPDTAR